MNPQEYLNSLKMNIPTAKEACGGSEIICKCFYCPDDGDHHHMYVSIPQNSNEVSKYNCFKCGAHGSVTQKKLMEWGLFDLDLNVMVSNHNKAAFNNPMNFKYSIDGVCKLNYKYITENKNTRRKLELINERLGTNFTFDDCVRNKIVLSIFDIFKQNPQIKSLTRDERVVTALNEYFLGFISYDNNYINMKNLVLNKGILYKGLDDTRFVNYNIYGKDDNSMKFIVYPNNLVITDPRPIKVHLAEGPFDALSVKYNLRKEDYNNLYIAVTGNGFKGVLRHLIATCKLMNLEIHLYPDNEPAKNGRRSTQEIIDDVVNYIRPFGFNIYVHLNQIGKDMGESLDKIKEYTYKI